MLTLYLKKTFIIAYIFYEARICICKFHKTSVFFLFWVLTSFFFFNREKKHQRGRKSISSQLLSPERVVSSRLLQSCLSCAHMSLLSFVLGKRSAVSWLMSVMVHWEWHSVVKHKPLMLLLNYKWCKLEMSLVLIVCIVLSIYLCAWHLGGWLELNLFIFHDACVSMLSARRSELLTHATVCLYTDKDLIIFNAWWYCSNVRSHKNWVCQ